MKKFKLGDYVTANIFKDKTKHWRVVNIKKNNKYECYHRNIFTFKLYTFSEKEIKHVE